jgi:hypothetical protein
MASDFNWQTGRNAIAARQVILFLVLAIVGAGGVYEFAFARPAFMAAWKQIEGIDESNDSGTFTAEKIEKLINRKPAFCDESKDNLEIRTYRWRSGLLFKNHEIFVVYTKILPAIVKENPKYENDRYYFSASAGTPITEANLPAERTTLVFNRNPPSMGGGPPPSDASGGNNKKGKEAGSGQGDDKKSDGADGDESAADGKDEMESADQQPAAEPTADPMPGDGDKEKTQPQDDPGKAASSEKKPDSPPAGEKPKGDGNGGSLSN